MNSWHPSGLAVVVVTYNSARDIEGFLSSLDTLNANPHPPRLRVIVADNASTDDTLARVRNHPRAVEIVETGGNLGYSGGINAAIRRLDPDATVVIANPDVRLLPGFIEAVGHALDEPHVGVVAPRLIDDLGRTQLSLRRRPAVHRAFADAIVGGRLAGRWGWGETVRDPAVYAEPRNVEWATGALLIITAACRRQVGAWDESFFLYSEETDYLLRATDAGFTIRYEPAAPAMHRGGALHENPRLWTTMSLNRVRLYRKRHGRTRTVFFFSAVLLNEALRGMSSKLHRHATRELIRRRRTLLSGVHPEHSDQHP